MRTDNLESDTMADQVRELTTRLEDGYGCDLRNLERNIPDTEQRHQLLADIVALNKKDHQTDADLPDLKLDTFQPKSESSANAILGRLGVKIAPDKLPERSNSVFMIRTLADGRHSNIYVETGNGNVVTSRCANAGY
jgi:hypothetical protein